MWTFHFEAPKGSRVLKRFLGITHFTGADMWWCKESRMWEPIDNYGHYSSHAPCRSFNAFKSHLKNHPELEDLGEVILVSRFEGHNIIARWEN